MEPTTQSWWDGQVIFNELRLQLLRQRQEWELREYLSDEQFAEELVYVLQTAACIPERIDSMARVEEWLLSEALSDYEFIDDDEYYQNLDIMERLWSRLRPILINPSSPSGIMRGVGSSRMSMSMPSIPAAEESRRSMPSIPAVEESRRTMPAIPAYASASHLQPADLMSGHSHASMPSMSAPPRQPTHASIAPFAVTPPSPQHPHSHASIASLPPVPPSGGYRSVPSLDNVPGYHPEVPQALWPSPDAMYQDSASMSMDGLSNTPMSGNSGYWDAGSGEYSVFDEPVASSAYHQGMPVGTSSSQNLPAHPSGIHDSAASLLAANDSSTWKSHMPTPDMRPAKGWWNSQSILNSAKLRMARQPEFKALHRLAGAKDFSDRFLTELEKAAKLKDCEEAQLHVYAWLVEEQTRVAGFEARDMWVILNPILQSYADAIMNPGKKSEKKAEKPKEVIKEQISKTQEEFKRILNVTCDFLETSLFQRKREEAERKAAEKKKNLLSKGKGLLSRKIKVKGQK